MASSCSSSSVQHKHDVFLSFRGEDTRYNITSHLYAALQRKSIETFIDNDLTRGEEISPALLKAIQESKISIVILSQHYASSSWCLEELCKILECKNTHEQIVIPIFYRVDPSDVRKQTGSFAEAFAKHEHLKERIDKVPRWRDALKEIGNLSGSHFQKDRSESELIEEIVKDISKKLKSINKSSNDSKGLVGLNSRIAQIESLLCKNKVDVRIVGIWGMGGIGKTTLAEAVFHKIFAEFEVYCFLANVREEVEKRGQVYLWEKLLYTILEETNLCMGTRLLPNFVRDRLSRKKALIVLDDVNDSLLFDLLRERPCFGPGSRIIITSRDKQVLQQFVDEDGIYEVKELIDDEALQLFCLNAFKQRLPMEDWMELSKKVIDYAKGIPLALKVLGSALYRKSKQEWESELNKLRKIPNPRILNLLRISYDGLDDEVKDIFLDIACFFRGQNGDNVAKILDGCYQSVHCGMSVLIDKSLLTISYNTLGMHDLIQEMGWNIVREESIKEPGKRSRLWNPKDVYHVLKNNSGTKAVEGISLEMSEIKEVHLNRATFAKMYNLRLLRFYNSNSESERKVYLSQKALEGLSDKLCYLRWDGYPLKSLPSNFCPENLVELNMTHSNVKRLWNGVQNLVKLKKLDLSYSQHLIEIPNLSRATNLKWMNFNDCKSLVEVPPSIGYLNELSDLSLSGCKKLGNLPNISHLRSLKSLHLGGCSNITRFPEVPRELKDLSLGGSAIAEVPSSVGCLSRLKYLDLAFCRNLERLPSSFCKLKSLQTIDLSGCLKLKSFPEILETMEGLERLCLDGSGIEELPSSIEYLINLHSLELQNNNNLTDIPSNLNSKSIGSLNLDDCNLSKFPSWLTCMSSLSCLLLRGNNFESIPPSIKQLSVLEHLFLSNCKRLQSIPELPSSLRSLEADHCTALEVVSLTEFIKDWVSDFDKTDAIFVFTNCLKLEQLAMGSIGKEAQLRSQQIANVHVEKNRGGFLRHGLFYQQASLIICFPGSEIPDWFTCQNTGSTISIQLHQRWHDCKFVGFTLGVVFAYEGNNNDSNCFVACQCQLKTEDFSNHPLSCVLYDICNLPTAIGYVDSDHVLLGYNFFLPSDWCRKFQSNQVSFDFELTDPQRNPVDNCKIKKCGVHIWYGRTDTGSGSSDLFYAQDRESNPNHDPTQLSFKCGDINQAFGEPMVEDGAVAKRHRDDYCYNEATPSKHPTFNEEEEEPFPKKFK